MAIPVSQVLSHWSHFFDTFSMSSANFYTQLEEVLNHHQMPNTEIKRTKHKEGGLLSAGREYLRVQHGELVFDVCAAPFGKDFFISWWLYETEGTMRNLLRSTKVGDFLSNRAAKRTFYQMDEEEMFRACVHGCILESVTKISEGKGLRALTDAEKAIKVGGM